MSNSDENEKDKLIQKRYQDTINYYWNASNTNKRWYKLTRSLTVIFGALVTLISSLSSSEIIGESTILEKIFALGTPVLAAILTIVAGFSQSFQWGSTWQNMVVTASLLQKEYDRYLVTPVNDRDYAKETEKLNEYVISESKVFFERMLGTGISTDNNGTV